MNFFSVASAVIFLTLLLGIGIASLFVYLSRLVTINNAEIEAATTGYNERATLGHRIKQNADMEEQLKEARLLAAQRAAALPRGANMGIGRAGESTLRPNSKGLAKDPISAVKIAHYHTWQGAASGPVAAAAAPVAVAAGPVKQVKRKLEAGKDFAFTPVAAGMSGPEKRQTRIANSKAKYAAYKALKASGQDMVAVAAAPAAGAPAGAAAPAAVAINVPPEPAYIEVTDSMSADDVRKARIENSKLRSAYNKQLKAAGIDPATMQPIGGAPAAAPVAAAPVAAAPAAAPAPAAANVPPAPDYTEITDDMSPDDKRRARIENSKLRSAYNKQLKAMGIDPSTIE